MADFDSKSNQKMLLNIAPAVLTADTNGATVDTLDFGSLKFGIYVGAGGITFDTTNKVEFKMQESDDASTWTLVPDDSIILDPGATAPGGTGIVRSLTAAKAAADTVMTTVGYRGKKRYARMQADFSGTHGTGTMMFVTATVGHSHVKPVGQANIADNAILVQ